MFKKKKKKEYINAACLCAEIPYIPTDIFVYINIYEDINRF